MKKIIINLFLLFFSLLLFFCGEDIFFIRKIYPINQHFNSVSKIETHYLISKNVYNLDDSILLNKAEILIHKNLHEFDDVNDCEDYENCQLHSSFILLSGDNSYLKGNLIKGEVPTDQFSICINENIAKRLKLNTDDKILINLGFGPHIVTISGIVENFYGIEKYDNSISAMNYCIATDSKFFDEMNAIGYSLSDNIQEDIKGKIDLKSQKKQFIVVYKFIYPLITIIINTLIIGFLFVLYCNILKIPQYYEQLYYLRKYDYTIGFSFKDIFCFLLLALVGILIPLLFNIWYYILLLQAISIVIVAVLLILNRRKSLCLFSKLKILI